MWADTDDFPANASTAGRLRVGTPANGVFERGNDEDWFAIDLTAGTKYLFNLAVTTGYVPFDAGNAAFAIQVFDANGTPVSSWQNGDDLDPAALEFDATASGTYYVAARSLYRWDGLGGYALSASVRTGPDDFAPDASTTGVLVPGGSAEGRFEVAGDHDWLKIHVDPLTYYQFSALGGDPYQPYTTDYPPSSMWLVDAAGRPFPMIWGGFEPNLSGDVYLDVLGLHADRHYTVISKVWRDDYVGDNSTTGRLAPGGQIAGTINFEHDVDRIKLPLQASAFYDFDLSGTPDYYTLTLYDANGVMQDYVSGNNFDRVLRLAFHPQASGDYYLDISRNISTQAFTGTDPYVVRMSNAVADDVGDTAASARAMAPDASVNAALQAHGDVDVFRVALHAGTRYAFALDAQGAPNPNLLLSLSDAGGTVLDSTRAHLVEAGIGLDTRFAFTAPADGDYYLSVATQSAGAQPYVLSTRTLSGDTLGPSLVGGNLHDGATNIALTANKFELVFSEPVVIDKGQVVVRDATGNAVSEVYVDSSNNYPTTRGASLLVDLLGLLKPGAYTLELPHSGIHDLAGNAYTGPASLHFSTITPASTGTSGNDVLAGGAGVTLDGGAGVDAVAYVNYSSSYTVNRDGANVTVTDLQSGKIDTLVNVERIYFREWILALDVDGNAGQAFRLYRAAFHRSPDMGGLGYWIDRLDHGTSLHDVASAFIDSDEFRFDYGQAQDDAAYITLLYNNVLHRAPDDAGLQFWEHAMGLGFMRADILAQFSESAENKAALATLIGNGINYTPY